MPVPPGFGQGLRMLGVSLTRPERDSGLISPSVLVPTFRDPPVGCFGGSLPPNRGDFPRGKGPVALRLRVSVDPGAFVFPGIGRIPRYPAEFPGTADISPFRTERRHFSRSVRFSRNRPNSPISSGIPRDGGYFAFQDRAASFLRSVAKADVVLRPADVGVAPMSAAECLRVSSREGASASVDVGGRFRAGPRRESVKDCACSASG